MIFMGLTERIRLCFRLPGVVHRGERQDKDAVAHLAHDSVWGAKTRGIAEADLMESAGGDLDAYMLTELNRAMQYDV
jgi:hypothetical protein